MINRNNKNRWLQVYQMKVYIFMKLIADKIENL